MPFGSKKQLWPSPEASVGQPCTLMIEGTQCWEAVGPAADAMKALYPHIKELLENNQELLEQGEDKPRGLGFNMWMEGKRPAASHPLVVFSSKSRRQRLQAKQLLKQSQLLDKYPGIKIKTLNKMPAIYRAGAAAAMQSEYMSIADHVYVSQGYRPACGAPIWLGSYPSELVTFGGCININDESYGLTAQHALFGIREDICLDSGKDEILSFDESSDVEDTEDVEDVDITSKGICLLYGLDATELTSVTKPVNPTQSLQELVL